VYHPLLSTPSLRCTFFFFLFLSFFLLANICIVAQHNHKSIERPHLFLQMEGAKFTGVIQSKK
jgi:hypothetical protein